MKPTRREWLRLTAAALVAPDLRAADPVQTDVCVYGGSAAGVAAAIQAARMGRTVALVDDGRHPGSMSVEGLGGSGINNHDFRNDVAIRGLAREFYPRIGRTYGSQEPVYLFEPNVAEQVVEEWLAEAGIRVFRDHRLAEGTGAVEKDPATQRIRGIRAENGARFRARVFLDGTIEGDLIAAAGVETIIGRESAAKCRTM